MESLGSPAIPNGKPTCSSPAMPASKSARLWTPGRTWWACRSCARCSSLRSGRKDGGTFDSGIQFALERMLVDPDFLLRVYRDPKGSVATYSLSNIELASRLSFFLWGSIPDERLLDLAERGQLSNAATLEKE